jgi:hypothetical protein
MQDRIKEIRDRVEKISPEPWVCRVREDGVNEVGFGTFKGLWCNSRIAEVYSNDAEFIVNSPSDIEFLLEALQEAQTEIENMESIGTDVCAELKQSQDRERVLREAVCLLNCMVCCGEKHSKQSEDLVNKALGQEGK